MTTDPLPAAALQAGERVAFPTESVYRRGADAESDDAVARIFAVKGGPTDHPLIVHGADADVLERYGRTVPPLARLRADAFRAP